MGKQKCIKGILISLFIFLFMFPRNIFGTNELENTETSNYAKYDLRDYIELAVKNQGSTQSCWAIATNTMIESNIAKTTGQNSPVFSAKYLEYATSKTFSDGTNPKAYNREVVQEIIERIMQEGGTRQDGGNSELALAFYACGNGPVLEDDMPFSGVGQEMSLENIQDLRAQKQIKKYVRFPSIFKKYSNGEIIYTSRDGKIYTDEEVKEIRNQIKQHIVNYGAISAKTYGKGVAGSANKYYDNPENITNSKAYFCNNTSLSADHQITIIGWDDNYSASNFNSSICPNSDGAYLVLNSWGENFGENGTYYISYEDVFIEQDLLGVVSTTDIDYDNIYQHDELGMDYSTDINGEVYCANVYEKSNSDKDEYITQIGISTLENVECDVYVNAYNDSLDENYLTKVLSNVKLQNGYQVIRLDQPIKLVGEKFVLIVKYKADERGKTYVGLEHKDGYFWDTAKSERGESFLSYNLKEWTDLKDLSTNIIPENSNFVMKAFTEYREKTEIEEYFNISKYELKDPYVIKISPRTVIAKFIENINTNMEYNVYDKNNNLVNTETIASTGMQLKVKDNSYKMVVRGDINGDGKISITDVVAINLFNIHLKEPNEIEKLAADINYDNKISITDVVTANLASINLREI